MSLEVITDSSGIFSRVIGKMFGIYKPLKRCSFLWHTTQLLIAGQNVYRNACPLRVSA